MKAGFDIAWRGHIDPDDDIPEQLPVLRDISFVSQETFQDASFSNLQIRSIAFVSSSAIPLRLIGTQRLRLFSDCTETKQWLVEQFIHDEQPDHAEHESFSNPVPPLWWLEDGAQSPRALLLQTYRDTLEQSPQEGQLLIFAATRKEHPREASSPPPIEFLVLDILKETSVESPDLSIIKDPTGPFSQNHDSAILDSPAGKAPSLEREIVLNRLDNPHAHPPVIFHDRRELPRSATTGSTEIGHAEHRQNKRLQSLDLSRRSSLSRVTSANAEINSTRPGSPSVSAIEEQNRAAIQRLIMIGMRMYGFSHRHRRQDSVSTPQTGAIKPMTPTSFDVNTKLRDFDDEYKQIYHQTYRGVCLALRNHIAVRALPVETLQRIVDSLLAVFCTNPLEESGGMTFDSGADARGEPRT